MYCLGMSYTHSYTFSGSIIVDGAETELTSRVKQSLYFFVVLVVVWCVVFCEVCND